jgi:hypothetical protein
VRLRISDIYLKAFPGRLAVNDVNDKNSIQPMEKILAKKIKVQAMKICNLKK